MNKVERGNLAAELLARTREEIRLVHGDTTKLAQGVVVILRFIDQILLISRPEEDTQKGKVDAVFHLDPEANLEPLVLDSITSLQEVSYSTPGGGVRQDETVRAAAVRELGEELSELVRAIKVDETTQATKLAELRRVFDERSLSLREISKLTMPIVTQALLARTPTAYRGPFEVHALLLELNADQMLLLSELKLLTEFGEVRPETIRPFVENIICRLHDAQSGMDVFLSTELAQSTREGILGSAGAYA